MFALLKKMVCINSGSHNKIGVDAVGSVVTDALAGCGLAVSVIAEEAVGNHLVVRTACPSTDTGGVLLAGHMDTVFPADTDFTDYWEDDTRAYGPGVIDMKGGLVAGIFALKALSTIGLLNRTEELHGIQVGLLNYAGNNDRFRWLPMINAHF